MTSIPPPAATTSSPSLLPALSPPASVRPQPVADEKRWKGRAYRPLFWGQMAPNKFKETSSTLDSPGHVLQSNLDHRQNRPIGSRESLPLRQPLIRIA